MWGSGSPSVVHSISRDVNIVFALFWGRQEGREWQEAEGPLVRAPQLCMKARAPSVAHTAISGVGPPPTGACLASCRGHSHDSWATQVTRTAVQRGTAVAGRQHGGQGGRRKEGTEGHGHNWMPQWQSDV